MNPRVLLIGWDAADWKVINPLMDAGRMPNVQRLVDNGAMGQLATLHPPLSPMLWTSIATGKRPYKHGIHGFSEPTADGLGIQPVTNLSRSCKAVWNILNQRQLRSIVIGWWPSHPAEPIRGVTVSDHYHRARGPLEKGWPMNPGCVHPPELREQLAGLRFHPDELHEDMIAPFIPKYREIDQKTDRRLAGCMRTLCECVSVHSAATWLIDNQPWDFFAVYYDAIDHFSHGFMRYHPPRQTFVGERDFELYHDVVSQAYVFHDMMLGALLGKIGEDVTVLLISDHGFHPDHLRPRGIPEIPAGPAIEHRDYGIVAVKGPGIKKDERLYGSSVLDITPTILTLYGLPVGADMDGKVLTGAFARPPEIRTIPSWEEVAGEDGRHPPHTRLDPIGARESLEQLVALGYIAKPDEDRQKAVADTIAELRYNLGEACQDAGLHPEALEIFRELHKNYPDEQRHAVHRFVSAQALELVDEMRAVVDDLDGRRRDLYHEALGRLREGLELLKKRRQEREDKDKAAGKADEPPTAKAALQPFADQEIDELLSAEERKERAHWLKLAQFQPPVVDFLKACVREKEGKYAEALELLERIHQAHLARPGLFLQAAALLIKLRRWDEAEATYVKALSVDPDNPQAHLGMARVHLQHLDYEKAAQAALDALQRLYHFPMAHFLLGVALTGLRDDERAAVAFQTALTQNPNFPNAHLRLAWLLRRRLFDPIAADEHFRMFYEVSKRARQAKKPPGIPSPPERSAAAPTEALAPTTAAGPCLPPPREEVIIVSGLPRSGTSMVMQMLAAGGLTALADGLREADADNPRGYFEYEPVKHLHQKADWIREAQGKVVKIVSPLLPYLPPQLACRVIFIDRNLNEVLDSQGAMLARRDATVNDSPERRERLRQQYQRHIHQIKARFPQGSGCHLLVLEYAAVIRDPRTAAERLNCFLGGQLAVDAMTAEVRPDLHRHRQEKEAL